MNVINKQLGKVSFKDAAGKEYHGLVHVVSRIMYSCTANVFVSVDITNSLGERQFLSYLSSGEDISVMATSLGAAVNALLNGSPYVAIIEDADNPGKILGVDISSN